MGDKSVLIAHCPSCLKELPIILCENWRGWEYDKGVAYGLCEDCKDVFKLYDGEKTIYDMIARHLQINVDAPSDVYVNPKEGIKTEWIEMEHGSQLRFAVPVESENEPVVDKVEEIKKEIMRYLDDCITESEKILNRDIDYSYTFKCILNTDIDANIRAKEEILKIFYKY